jgi:hypothetical protein
MIRKMAFGRDEAAFGRNSERANANGQRFCEFCGRAIGKSGEAGRVHVIDSGANILHPADESQYRPDGGDFGWHPIGPECAKRFGEFVSPAKE